LKIIQCIDNAKLSIENFILNVSFSTRNDTEVENQSIISYILIAYDTKNIKINKNTLFTGLSKKIPQGTLISLYSLKRSIYNFMYNV